MKKITSSGTIRKYSVAVTVLTIGGVLLLYMDVIVEQSQKMPSQGLSRVVNIDQSVKTPPSGLPVVVKGHHYAKTPSHGLPVVVKKSARPKSSRNQSNVAVVNQTIHILLSAYHRSGSSYTGNLLASQPNTFYFFEPLIKLGEWGHFTADNQLCSDLTGTCRLLNSSSENLKPIQNHMNRYNMSKTDSFDEVLHHLLHNIYDCHLDHLENLILEGVTNAFTNTLKKLWFNFNRCRTKQSKHDCLPMVTEACRKSRVRVIKLVRLSLTIAAPLLEKDQALKLVHLFRDPRGTIASRLVKTKWYPLFIANNDYSKLLKNAEVLCKRMIKDFDAGSILRRRFPNRVKLIKYEDLNGNDVGALKVKDELRTFLNLNTESYSQRSKSNSTSDWIRTLDWKVIEIVDSVCGSVYQKLGYSKIDHQTWLDNS